MQKPMTLEDYLAAPYIVEPLRLPDYCLVNDGGVAMIITTAERARRISEWPVYITAVGKSDLNVDASSMRPRIKEFYRSAHIEAANQVYEMAGLGPEDMDCLQIYDSFSIHVPMALDGFGFFPRGEPGAFLRSGAIRPGGRLPVNTSGGLLSESYMQGCNLHAEAVRQVRGSCGPRQTPNCRHVQTINDAIGHVTTIIYTGGSGRIP